MLKGFFTEENVIAILEPIRAERIKRLKIAAAVCWLIMVVAQIYMACTFNGTQTSDAAIYLKFAKQVLAEGFLYPSTTNIHDTYIFGNGYVNYIAFILGISNSIRTIYFINVLWTQLLLFACIFIVRKILPGTLAEYYLVILFSLLNAFWAETVLLRTELVFTSLCFSAIALMFSNVKGKHIYGGILIGLANWIRPLGIVFLIGAVIVSVYKQNKIKKAIPLVASYVCIIAIIGGATYMSCGHFIYQASTSGYNLFMTANDEADGSYMDVFSEGQQGYIPEEKRENMLYSDFNDYYTKMSVHWILQNPVKYISLFPAKIIYMFATETYSGGAFFNNEIATGGKDYLTGLLHKLIGTSNEALQVGDVLIMFNQAWYMGIMLLFAIGFVLIIKKHLWRRFLPFFAVFVLGSGMTLAVVAGARYHFPYLPIFLIVAAYTFSRIDAKKATPVG